MTPFGKRPITCTCGYQASSVQDFEEHVGASMSDPDDHFET